MAFNMVINQSMLDNMTVERFCLQKENYDLHFFLQRNEVWDNYKKSNLIHSLILNLPVPTLVMNQETDGKLTVLDGLQRSLSVLKFVNNEYALANGIESVVIKDIKGNEVEYTLEGKYFRDFDDKLQNHLLTRIIKVEICKGLDIKTKSEIVKRLNMGVAMSGIDKVRVTTHDSLLPLVTEIKNSELFNRKLNMTKANKAKWKSDEKLIYSIIAYECNILVNDNIEKMVSEVLKANHFTSIVQKQIISNINYLNLAFPTKVVWFNTINFIPIYSLLKANRRELDTRAFYNILCDIFQKQTKYNELCGNWNDAKPLNNRIEVLNELFQKQTELL